MDKFSIQNSRNLLNNQLYSALHAPHSHQHSYREHASQLQHCSDYSALLHRVKYSLLENARHTKNLIGPNEYFPAQRERLVIQYRSAIKYWRSGGQG